MNPFNLDITRIVKYVCMTVVAIVSVSVGCATLARIAEAHLEAISDKNWDDEE